MIQSLNEPRPNKYLALRAGLLLAGVGVGFAVGMFMTPLISESLSTLNIEEWKLNEYVTTCWFAIAAIFGGISLLISYLIESHNEKK